MAKDSVSVQDAEKKRRKQEKKLAKQARREAEQNGEIAAAPEEQTINEQEVPTGVQTLASTADSMDVDTNGDSTRESKKRKRTAKDASTPSEGTPAAASEKKSKRQKSEVEDSQSSKLDTTEKKKKKKKDRKAEEAEQATEALAVDATESKKKKRKDKHETSVSTPEVATTAAAPASAAEIKQFLTSNNITIHSPGAAVVPILAFDQLNIPDALRTSFTKFKKPSPIQACTWPPSLEGKDVVGIAETGSGKTLAFGIPALVKLIQNPKSTGISVLVVAPTRELALQTRETLGAIGKSFNIDCVAVFGGVPKEPQIKMLAKSSKNTKIIVGTPGRIIDLMNDGACDLSGIDYLVLDEADRMLDKGFENDIRNIIGQTKPSSQRQTLMFSATWPESVRRLASSFLNNPVRVTVGSDELTANSRVEQFVEVFDDSRTKDSRLLSQLSKLSHKKKANPEDQRILVFGLYKKETSRVEQMLRRQGYAVGALHGDMAQTARMQALDSFRKGETTLLVATDVAARGLDIPNVGVVINYTFPLTIEDYVHRIGRTGRGGKEGKSITYFTGDNHERSLAGEFSKLLRDSGYPCEVLKDKFPMTIKKKEHSVYGAFFRDDIPVPKAPTRVVFD